MMMMMMMMATLSMDGEREGERETRKTRGAGKFHISLRVFNVDRQTIFCALVSSLPLSPRNDNKIYTLCTRSGGLQQEE